MQPHVALYQAPRRRLGWRSRRLLPLRWRGDRLHRLLRAIVGRTSGARFARRGSVISPAFRRRSAATGAPLGEFLAAPGLLSAPLCVHRFAERGRDLEIEVRRAPRGSRPWTAPARASQGRCRVVPRSGGNQATQAGLASNPRPERRVAR